MLYRLVVIFSQRFQLGSIMTTANHYVPTLSTRGPLPILASYRIFACHPSRLSEKDENILQGYYEQLQLDPSWGIRLQIADAWARDPNPLFGGSDHNYLWHTFRRALASMDTDPILWGLRYPELRKTLGW